MATYTPTGLAVVGASYTQKAGTATSAFTASGLDATTRAEAGTATSAFVSSGLDARTAIEAGTATSAFVASGLNSGAHTYTKTGLAVSGAVVALTKTGQAIASFAASSTDAKTSAETGAGVTSFTAGGLKDGTTRTKAGIAIAGEYFIYPKSGTAISARVASGTKVGTFTYLKTGSGVLAGVGGGVKVSSTGKSGGNMTPPYGSFVFGDEDYGEDTYGGFRNDARRIASGTKVVTSPGSAPSVNTGQGVSTFTASGTKVLTHNKTGTATSERSASGARTMTYGETGGNMQPPYGTVSYGDGDYGDGWYGGFRNDGRRIASGFANKDLGKSGAGILNLVGGGFFIPATVAGDVEISELDDILLEIEDLLGTPTSGDDVVLTVTES